MDYKELFKDENEEVKERYQLVISGIKNNIKNCVSNTKNKVLVDYFKYVAEFVERLHSVHEIIEDNKFTNLQLENLESLHILMLIL